MVLNYSRGLAEEFAGWKDLGFCCLCVYVFVHYRIRVEIRSVQKPRVFRSRMLVLSSCSLSARLSGYPVIICF